MKTAQSIKIVSRNIQNFLHPEEIYIYLRDLKKQGVQFICLQEVNHLSDKTIPTKIMDKSLPSWQKEEFHHKRFGQYEGFATLWNPDFAQLIGSKRLLFDEPVRGRKFYEKVLVTHIVNGKGALITTFKLTNGKTIRITNAHLHWSGGHKQRIKEAKIIKKTLEELGSVRYEIICGDFNTVGLSTLFGKKLYKKRQEQIQQTLGKDFINVFENEAITHTAFGSVDPYLNWARTKRFLGKLGMHCYQKLDYIFVKGLIPIEYTASSKQEADHYSLYGSFVPNE